ncbi:ATP-binding protein [Azohydromonas caseinilytica]|uniref:AAA family ATPase n=1 Tax=Azohydromonas caseinilytica TaxID=2728836 RepID=A0A848FCN6_9BURK|nr:adenylate/guanylate cyclase domain-containing protein [Azohydromonas caseinilytica]NML16736.1 AAA family ATPase [Azohydromonas caseinilytica]
MTSRAAAAPERRQLTVMFCDLVGSTAMAQRLDPEDLRALILRFQQLVRDRVARYEGFVARYMGDGVLVYFGYPVAHEDDAARAIHAGLDLVHAAQLLRPPLDSSVQPTQLRVGIATGVVVVGDRIGAGAAEEAAAVGEAPNLASRLQSWAEPQTVLVADRTQQLAGSRFVYAPPRELALNGYLQPVRAWAVVRPNPKRSRFDQTHPVALTPWVGRADELSRLLDLWRNATHGVGRLVLVVGEAGVGKSRLVQTLGERIVGAPFYRICYQCSPYHVDSALHPFIHQLEKAAGFAPGEAVSSRLDKLRRLLDAASPALAGATPLFAELLSLPMEGPAQSWPPERRRRETMAAILGRLRELALQRPVLLVLEDAHWVDPSTLELLGLLAAALPRLPVLLVVTSRVADTGQAWLQGPHASVLNLQRLTPQQAAELASHVAMPTPAAAEQLAQVVERADGVPLFIEELAKAIGGGLPTSEIPGSLHDLLMARLDQLGSAKETAQVAAVIGREFSREFLEALLPLPRTELDTALATMVDTAIVQRRPQGQVFAFHHALIQDVAYGSLLRTRRFELHGAIAEAIERLDASRAHTEPELVARHYALAGRPLPATRWWAQAALRALGRSANIEALRHSERGGELLPAVPEGAERERLELMLAMLGGAAHRALHGFASIHAERCFARALELSEKLGDVATQVDVHRGLFSWHYARGELGLARAQGQRVADIGNSSGDRAACMLGQWMLGSMSMWQGEFCAASRELELAVSLYRPEEHRLKTLAAQIDPGVNAMAHLSWVRWIAGDSDGAVEAGARAVHAARSLAQPYALTMALFFACAVRACRGEHDQAEPLLRELFAVTGEHRLDFLRACAWILRGQASIAADRCEDGLLAIERALSEFDELHAGIGQPWALAIAASGCSRLGRRDEALQKIAAAFAAIERHGERHWEAEVWRVKGELLWPSAQARGCLLRAADVAAQQSAGALRARALASLASLEK